MTVSLRQKFRNHAVFVIPMAVLSIALGVSLYYNVTASLPPNNIVGIVYKTDEGIDADQFGERPRYSAHLCLFVDDKINGVAAGECRDYLLGSEDYTLIKQNDVVRGQVIPGPFRGYNIIDIQEIYFDTDFVRVGP